LRVADWLGRAPAKGVGVEVVADGLAAAPGRGPVTRGGADQGGGAPVAGRNGANALREFLADTNWGALDVLLLDLPPGTDRLSTIASLVPSLSGIVVVTIPSDVSHLVVRRSITVAANTRAPVLGLVENMAGLFMGP